MVIDLDGPPGKEIDLIDCRVHSVSGPVATLAPVEEVAPALREGLTAGALGFMTFTHRRAPIALRGVILTNPDREELEFVVVDGVQVAERRSGKRVALVAPVQAVQLDDGGQPTGPVTTVTADLSVGGALVRRCPGLGEGPRWQLELDLPGDPDLVRTEAVLARTTPTHIGLKLVNTPEADQIRLGRVLADCQRR